MLQQMRIQLVYKHNNGNSSSKKHISNNCRRTEEKETQMPLDMNKKWKTQQKCMYNDRI